jgi:ABC-type transport system substrate-binding protein
MMEGWTGDNGDPDNFIGELWGCQEHPGRELVALQESRFREAAVRRARRRRPGQAAAIYASGPEDRVDDAPWIFVNSTLQIRAIRKEVKGYELNPTQMFFGMEKVSLQ